MGWFGFGGTHNRASPVTADQVEGTTLTQTTFREGYDPEEVDAFLRECVANIRWLEGGPEPVTRITPEQILHKRFSQTKFRAGYDQSEVDDLLDRVTATLKAADGTSAD